MRGVPGLCDGGRYVFGHSTAVACAQVSISMIPRRCWISWMLADALAFAAQLREQPNAVPVAPGARHWDIFQRLCTASAVRGNLAPDAYLAALAIESGCEWVTTDRDFARFDGLRIRSPG